MIRPEIKALIERGNITSAELKELRCNSWEWEAIIPALDDNAFLEMLDHTVVNCFFPPKHPTITYNDALGLVYVPELVRRFKALKGAA